jgi:uncharacterized zinc-type alcohol dehydrogenase-like protein
MTSDGTLVAPAMVCEAQGQPLFLKSITLPPMKDTMVECDLLYCGLCHTDIYMRDNDWGITKYPLVAGHEGVAKVRKVGFCVKNLQVGDLVGITWIRDSCTNCKYCLQGRENVCEQGYKGVYLGFAAGPWGVEGTNEYGGCFSNEVRIEERFAFKLPEGLPMETACPLLCGGGTVFEVVVDYVTYGTRVGVASIGGLRTAAIKFAKSFGGYVTALSRGDAKKEKCLGVGADAYSGCLGNPEEMAKLEGKFDLIIDTSPVNADVGPYMSMLKFNGTYCRVGIPRGADMTFKYDYIPLIFTLKKIEGRIVTGSANMARILQLVKDQMEAYTDMDEWKTEAVPFEKVNEAMEKLASGKNGKTYRYLLKW